MTGLGGASGWGLTRQLGNERLNDARTLHDRIFENRLQFLMLGMGGGGDVLGRKHSAALVAEAVVPLKNDGVRIHFLGQPDECGHFSEVRALHDEGESEADRVLGIEEKIAADRLD